MQNNPTHFAPELHIPNGTITIDFYTRFGATEHFCLRNDDGSIHVAELDMNGAVFHLHETMPWFDALEPVSAKGVTAVIGLFVTDVDEIMLKAIQREQLKSALQKTRNMVTGRECSKILSDITGKYRRKCFKSPTQSVH